VLIAEPGLRQRDAADRLGCSEGALVASQLGAKGAVLLAPRWLDVLRDFESLGPVMALTRNQLCVIEKVGRSQSVTSEAGGQMGQVLDAGIDLRIFFRSWGAGFACRAPTAGGEDKLSFQFYSPGGEAVHKVHLRGESSRSAFEDLVARYRHERQSDPFDLAVTDPPPAPEKPDDQVDGAALLSGWEALEDTHEFFHLLRRVGASRTQALRLGSPKWAQRVRLGSWRQVVEQARDAELPLMAFVGSRGVIQIHTGPVKKIVPMEKWFNVMDPGFNLHLHEPGVSEAWVVRKPAQGVIVESLELYDATGGTVALFFVKRKEGRAPPPSWSLILSELARA
jgi:putative hemin transport protein